MPVTRHPLRRSGREVLPHPAPTLGRWRQAALDHRGWPHGWLAVHASTPGTRAPGAASGTCDVAACSPWSPPFPPPAPLPVVAHCSRASSVLCWCLTSP